MIARSALLSSLAVVLTALILPSWAAAQSTQDWTFCATEGEFCAFTGTQEVRYGANGSYRVKLLTGGTACSNAVFGDPLVGTVKECSIGDVAPSADWVFCAEEGDFCAFAGTQEVRYGANGSYRYETFSGGIACTNSVFGDPLNGVRKQCHITSTTPPASSTPYGPRSTISCPAGAIDIWPGTKIQSLVSIYPGATTFCITAGVHSVTSAITPKTGNVFVGEYGAVLDGANWITTDSTQGAFRAHNQDIDDVTIRNLVIRNMPQRGIHAFYWASDRWTIEYNEIAGNDMGVLVPNNSLVRNNSIHHNTGGGYLGWRAVNTVFESNEIAYNGTEQKVVSSTSVTFRNNFVHHNAHDGIWYDADNTGALVEGNRIEDNAREGIFYEISSRAVIRNNTVRRNAFSGIFISTSKDVEIYNNTLEDNYRGIQFYLNCGAVGDGRLDYDLSNNTAHDNTVRVGTRSGSFANGVGHLSSCTATQVAPYLNGSKNLRFIDNTYSVPSTTTKYWLWGFNTLKSWSEWSALGQE